MIQTHRSFHYSLLNLSVNAFEFYSFSDSLNLPLKTCQGNNLLIPEGLKSMYPFIVKKVRNGSSTKIFILEESSVRKVCNNSGLLLVFSNISALQ